MLYTLVKSIFEGALYSHLVRENPCHHISLPKIPERQIEPLTVDQVATLAAAMPDRYQAMITVQAALGLRVFELLALQQGDVALGSVKIQRQLGESGQYTDLKTPSSARTIPLVQEAALALNAHMAKYPPLDDGLIFYSSHGKRYSQGYYSTVFKEAVRKAGLPAKITSHYLRHTFASALLSATGDPVLCAKAMGHKNAVLVLKLYAHLLPGSMDRTRKALEAVWGVTSVSHQQAPSG